MEKNIRYAIDCATSKPNAEIKRTYTVEEIQGILGISAPTAHTLVRRNLFRYVKVGRSIRISKKSFDEWLDCGMPDGGVAYD